jgi:hypothetical protein
MVVPESLEGIINRTPWFHYDVDGDVLYLRLAFKDSSGLRRVGNAPDARRRDEATQSKESLRSENEAGGAFPARRRPSSLQIGPDARRAGVGGGNAGRFRPSPPRG